MNKLTVRLSPGLSGRAMGTAANAGLQSLLQSSSLAVLGLASTSPAGGGQATQGIGPQVRTLTAGSNETIDLQNFTNTLGETGQTFTSAIRLFYLIHAPGSLASSITVGNAGAGAWTPFGWPAGTTVQLRAKGLILLAAPDATGLAVDAGHHLLKVSNDDDAKAASYEIGCWGV